MINVIFLLVCLGKSADFGNEAFEWGFSMKVQVEIGFGIERQKLELVIGHIEIQKQQIKNLQK